MVEDLVSVTVIGRERLRQVILGLTWHHQWFQVTPLPEDEWRVDVKAENGKLLSDLLLEQSPYLILPRPTAKYADHPCDGELVRGAYVMGWLYVDLMEDSGRPVPYAESLIQPVTEAARAFYCRDGEVEIDDGAPVSWSEDVS